MTEIHHSFLGYMVITNKTFWEKLPADIRNELEIILAQVTEEVKAKAVEQADRDRQAVINQDNVKIIMLTDQEKEVWRQAITSVWAQFASQIDPVVIAVAQAANNQAINP